MKAKTGLVLFTLGKVFGIASIGSLYLATTSGLGLIPTVIFLALWVLCVWGCIGVLLVDQLTS